MPDIAFHISSETADANGHCPSGDRTRITLPIEPAIQVPNDAQPVAWLHNLAFTNSIANISASDSSDTIVLGTGDGALKFQNGTQTANAPFVGFKYKVTDSDGTEHDMAMVAPSHRSTDCTERRTEWTRHRHRTEGQRISIGRESPRHSMR